MPDSKSIAGGDDIHKLGIRPTPLLGELAAPVPIDIGLLGPFEKVVKAIAAKTQAPVPIAMHSVLAAASVATQPFVNVQTLSGQAPISLYLITVAASGERKSTCDKMAVDPLRSVESERRRYQGRQRRTIESGDAFDVIETEASVLPPGGAEHSDVSPKIIFSDVTIEGLAHQLQNNQPSIGLISDEGGQFIGGHSMKAANTVGSAARLSKLWDAGQLELIRATCDPVELHDRRVSMHMMIQPNIAGNLFSNEILRDQGLLSRCLAVWPESRIGFRFIEADDPDGSTALSDEDAIGSYNRRIKDLLKMAQPVHPEDPRHLKPRLLQLSSISQGRLVRFYNRVEEAQRPGGAFASIQGFAAKGAEHAARIAAVMTVFESSDAEEISGDVMAKVVQLMDWYLLEMLRIRETHVAPEIVQKAEQLRTWILERWKEDRLSVRVVTQRGPACVRDADTAKALIAKLVEHGWLVPQAGSAVVGGQRAKNVWRIVRSDVSHQC